MLFSSSLIILLTGTLSRQYIACHVLTNTVLPVLSAILSLFYPNSVIINKSSTYFIFPGKTRITFSRESRHKIDGQVRRNGI